METTARPITSLSINKYPHYLLFFDTESYILVNGELKYVPKVEIIEYGYEHHILRLGVLIYVVLDNKLNISHREVYYFSSPDEFWDYVELKTHKDHTLYIYAHNAKYDTLNIDVISQLDRLGYDFPFPTINNAFIISASKTVGKKAKKKIKIVDTFNYVRQSVASIGKSVGIEKIELGKKGEIDFNKISDKELFIYCENDVHIIEEFILHLIRFLSINDLGSLKFTTASTALAIYRHKFINNQIYYHKNDAILKLERSGYRGGIVECFKLGKLSKQKYYLLDINSMYVNVMKNYKLPLYPILHISEDNKPQKADLIHSLKKNYIIADVLIKVKSNNGKYGLKHDNKLIFPIGTFRITLHNPEIIELLKSGNKLIKVFSYTIYHHDYCLNDYAHYFSELKKNSKNKVDYDLAKLFGNGLYGKFGMRKYQTETADLVQFFLTSETNSNTDETEYLEKEYTIKDENDNYKVYKINKAIKQKLSQSVNVNSVSTNKGVFQLWQGKYIRTYTDEFIHVPRTNVALAGSVTAYARILLSKYIQLAGDKNAFYSDTDSIIVNEQGYKNLLQFIDEKELGKLKCEMIFNSGVILAPKNYTFTLKKEFKKLKIKSLTLEHLCNNIYVKNFRHLKKVNTHKHTNSIIIKKRVRSKGIPNDSVFNDGIIYYMRFTTFKEYLKSGGQLKGRVQQHKTLSYEYTKGERGCKENDNFTIPFSMSYIENNEVNGKWQNQIIETKQKTKKKKEIQKLAVVN